MPPHARTILGFLSRLAAPAASDASLLARWTERRDEAAFSVLVARHGPMVLGVCRRVLGEEHAAEDAFQATFLVLARKASALRRAESLPSFLFGVALRLARKTRGSLRRRIVQTHLDAPEPADPHPNPLDALTGRELLALLDEEVARLPEVYRLPLLLCVMQGRTVEEAASMLGWTFGSLRGRLARGREKLRERLTRRGLTMSVGALALLAPAAVPEHLRGDVIRNLAVPAAPAVSALAAAQALKLKVACFVLFVLIATGLGASLPLLHAPEPEAPAAAPPDAPPVQAKDEPRRDRYGDPLPEGAVARLGTLRFRINAHQVDRLAFAPDGKTLAVATSRAEASNGLHLIDTATGKQTKFIPSPRRSVGFEGGVFSADCKRLVTIAELQMSGSRKTVLQIWDVASGRKVSKSDVEWANVLWWGCTVEGQPLIACLGKGEIILRETATDRKRRFPAKDLPDPTSGFPCWCAVGKNLLIASNEKGVVHLWDITSGEERDTLQVRGELVHNPVLSPNERWLATLSRDAGKTAVQLWEATTGKATHLVAAEQRFLHGIAFTPDGKTLATIGWLDVHFWDVASGKERGRTRGGNPSFAASVAFTPDGKTMATAERYSGAIHLWDLATGEPKSQPDGHSTYWPDTPAFAPDGKRVATSGGIDGTIGIWDAATGKPLAWLRRAPSSAAASAFSADGRALISLWDDKLLVSDAATGREMHVLTLNDPDRPNIRQQGGYMYLSDDGRKVITLSSGAAPESFQAWLMTGWDTATRKQVFHRPLAFHGDPWFAVSADASILALPNVQRGGGSPSGRITGKGPMLVEDLKTGDRLLTFPTLKGQTWPLTFSPDGRLLISHTSGPAPPGVDGASQTLRVWEVLTASELLALPMFDSNSKVAISPDNRLLATTASSGEILLWHFREGKELHRFNGFDAQVTSLAFSPDGRRLVSGLSDSTLLVWDVAAVRSKDRPAALDAASVRRGWNDLAASARQAFAARQRLAAAPDQGVALLRQRLKPAQAADRERVRLLLVDLDSEQFAVREKASRELARLGELAEPALRQALADKHALEVRRRIHALLDNLRGPVTRPELLQSLRAVAVLEDIATGEARQLLEELAKGAPEAQLTRAAKESLRRLALRQSAGH